ncbi:MAG: FKBP-type peptidyl-prolyl cis-trans isomerase [Phycisphaerales bacterium]
MKSLMSVVAGVLVSVSSVLGQGTPSAEPAKNVDKDTAPAPAAAPKAEEPKVVHREERPDGLIIEDFVVGTGAEVKAGALVAVHYRGTLRADGSEFDSSYKRGEPIVFPLAGLIKGWQDGIPGMKVGGKRRLTVPWASAYGENGRPPVIPAKADLVFDIEVLDTLVTEDAKEGTGAAFSAGMNPKVRYTLRKAGGGEVITESKSEGQTLEFRKIVMALQFGLDGMKEQGKRVLKFPAMMAWQQTPLPLPAGTKLECEVELLEANSAGQGG